MLPQHNFQLQLIKYEFNSLQYHDIKQTLILKPSSNQLLVTHGRTKPQSLHTFSFPFGWNFKYSSVIKACTLHYFGVHQPNCDVFSKGCCWPCTEVKFRLAMVIFEGMELTGSETCTKTMDLIAVNVDKVGNPWFGGILCGSKDGRVQDVMVWENFRHNGCMQSFAFWAEELENRTNEVNDLYFYLRAYSDGRPQMRSHIYLLQHCDAKPQSTHDTYPCHRRKGYFKIVMVASETTEEVRSHSGVHPCCHNWTSRNIFPTIRDPTEMAIYQILCHGFWAL